MTGFEMHAQCVSEIENYRTILRHELSQRCYHNPRYSLRAFARDLGLVPSRISEILSGKQGMSRRVALLVGERLGYSQENLQAFADLVDCLHCRSQRGREQARRRLTMRPFSWVKPTHKA